MITFSAQGGGIVEGIKDECGNVIEVESMLKSLICHGSISLRI